jgi:hypothetical protein
VPARAQGAGKEFPGRVNLSVSRPSPVPYRGWPLPPGQAAAAKPLAVAGKVDGERLVFLDVDGNGKFDDAGIDGWTLEGCRAMVPVQPRIFVGMRSISLRFPESGFELRYDASAIGGTDKALEGLKTLNLLRLRNGIPPVDMDSGLSAACLKHARYCQKNGFAFKEDPAKPEASKEGASAAANSIAGWMDPAAFARACYAQFFAREMLFHPLVEVVGIGEAGDLSLIDTRSRHLARSWNWPVLVPAPGAVDVPRAFCVPEDPAVYPEGTEPGFPITLLFETEEVKLGTAELRLGGAKGPLVPCLVSAPGRPAVQDRPRNASSIGLVPRQVLAPRTKYTVLVSYVYRGVMEDRAWDFTTATE